MRSNANKQKKKKHSGVSVLFLAFLAIAAIVLFVWVKPAKEAKIAEKTQQQEEQIPGAEGYESESETEPEAEEPVSTVDKSQILLVNKTHPLGEDYVPSDLVTVEHCVDGVGTKETRTMCAEAAEALEKLIAGAADAGYEIAMRTGFRSYEYQQNLFASYASRNGEEAANKYSAKAGESEHQSGLCCDVSSPSVGWQLSYDYGKTEEGKWLSEHAAEYGFIVRYLEGKEDITGYNYEPWHIRYVGVDAAMEIYEAGLTLEEYLGEV